MLLAWLSARSVARGLPAPVPDRGGFRVDTNSTAEVARWVFAQLGPGIEQLAHSINEPRFFLKLCGTPEQLRTTLPDRWQIEPPSYFMTVRGAQTAMGLAAGYRMELAQAGTVSEARIVTESGALAASGYAAETDQAFIYDRILTEPGHRRKGLGSAIMTTLRQAKRHCTNPELLVATRDGQSLYTALGWETISEYSTASIISRISTA